MSAEIVLSGIGVSHGIATGPAYIVQLSRPKVPQREAGDTTAEQKRFEDAVETVRGDLLALKGQSKNLPEEAAEELDLLLDAHLAMITGSRLIRGALKKIAEENINAEWALDKVMRDLAAQFRAVRDNYIAARIDDVEAVGNRILRALMNLPWLSLDAVPPGGIVLAKEITPADAAQLDPRRIAGLATVHGGAAGHTAVMARSLGLPAVLGLDPAILERSAQGTTVIVDGVEGRLILNPTAGTLAQYEGRRANLQRDADALAEILTAPAATKDGTEITLRSNLEIPRETEAIKAAGARGIGLFRTEFLFMNRTTLPGEDEQFEAMAGVVKQMEGESVTFRTLDIGGDKLAKSLGEFIGEAANPALGLRAIRLSLKEPHLLRTQLRAIIRAGAFGPVKILLPMVTTADEVERSRAMLRECYKELKNEKAAIPDKIPQLGTMIEIPAAALSADGLAAVSDFFALGTNDLVQYTVAIDRGNDQVASLYNPLNPAVLRLIEFTVEAAKRMGIPVSICGEMGADPKYTALLIGLGIREFSVGFSNVPRIKSRIRSLNLAQCEEHARQVMNQYEPARITELVRQFRP
ncbi:MAG TPA: phosphoenolpyruvate--protein phosphotransferase [Patescibacteria group bacterium]|nr:phosphoenolpyruvate--protein phosphotransferase [Patescibacteria group bacterium]